MKKKQAHVKGAMSFSKAMLIGLSVGITVCLLGVMITAYLINEGKIEIAASGYGVVITLLVASFLTSAVTLANRREKVLLTSVICAAVLMGVLIIFNVIIYSSGFDGVVVTAAVVLAGSIAAALLSSKPKKSKMYRGPKMGNR